MKFCCNCGLQIPIVTQFQQAMALGKTKDLLKKGEIDYKSLNDIDNFSLKCDEIMHQNLSQANQVESENPVKYCPLCGKNLSEV